MVDHVQLIWPLRDRQRLIDALTADPTVNDDGTGPIDPEDENRFRLLSSILDREKPAESRIAKSPASCGISCATIASAVVRPSGTEISTAAAITTPSTNV